jgi:hypothetical protein
LSEQKVLHRDQYFDLISEVFLERPAPMNQCGTQFRGHWDLLLAVVANPEVMPQAEAYRVGVLL